MTKRILRKWEFIVKELKKLKAPKYITAVIMCVMNKINDLRKKKLETEHDTKMGICNKLTKKNQCTGQEIIIIGQMKLDK